MASKLNLLDKKLKGFSLIELLIAIAIFAIVVSANFALAMNAYRGRANDRVRLEAGLVIKDTINGVYTYKNNNWSQILAGLEDAGFGEESKRLDLVENKFQLNSGDWTVGKINFSMYINKASRSEGEINPEASGGDPDTVKVTVIASWTDFFGMEQQITENYFLSNWASARWTETTNAEFLDGDPAPVQNKTKVEGDSVSLTNETVYANSDWCNLVNDVTVKNVSMGGEYSSSTVAHVLASKRAQTDLGYRVYEPEVTFPPPMPEAPDPPAASTITLNNTHPVICNESSGIPILECETLVKIYKSLGGSSWTNKTGWDSIDTGIIPTGGAPQPTITEGSVESQISQSTDDGHTSGTSIVLNNQNIFFQPVSQHAGMRFNNITIPQGSTISSATITWFVANSNNDILDTTFYAEAADNSQTFSTYADMIGRPKTTANIYTNQDFNGAGTKTLGINLNQLVQEVVSRPGWSSGNSLSILAIHNTGTDVRIRAFDSANPPPKITINYTTTTYGPGSGGPCSWYGVTCSGGRVIKLELLDNGLSGSIPREIGNLTQLKEFKIYHSSKNNQLVGSIPPEIGLLTELELFELVNVAVSGRIPETIGNLTNLDKLTISFTNVTGKLPASIGRLQNLSRLDLFTGRLTCHIPPEITLINPAYLNIGNNYFVSTRYSQIFDKVNTYANPFYPPPEWIDEEAFLDCAIAPAESSTALYQTTVGTDSIQQISLSNSDFPPEVSLENIFEQNGNTGLSRAFKFTSDLVTVPYQPKYNISEDGFTLAVWVRRDSNPTVDYAPIVTATDGSSNGWRLTFGPAGAFLNRVWFQHYGADPITLMSSINLPQNDWMHISIVAKDNVAKMYIFGEEYPVQSDSYSNLAANVSNPLRMGNNAATNQPAPVSLDELRIYDRALSPEEISRPRVFIEVDRADAGLVGYWRMNHPTDLSNQTVYDYSYLGNHGTLGINGFGDANDPEGVDGRTKYRINSMYHYKEKIFFATSNLDSQVLVYDKYNVDGVTWNSFNLGLPNNNRDTKAIFVDGNKGYAIQDSYIIEFDPEAQSAIAETATNLNPGSTGISSPTSINGAGNKIYVTGLDPLRNFMMLDVTNGLSQSSIESVQNILLNTYL